MLSQELLLTLQLEALSSNKMGCVNLICKPTVEEENAVLFPFSFYFPTLFPSILTQKTGTSKE